MTIENLTPIITSSVGGFFIGIILGYFLKKIIKIIMFVTGGIIALLLYLQQQQIVSINTDKIEDSSALVLTFITSSFDSMTQIDNSAHSFGIPLTASLAVGFTLGLIRS